MTSVPPPFQLKTAEPTSGEAEKAKIHQTAKSVHEAVDVAIREAISPKALQRVKRAKGVALGFKCSTADDCNAAMQHYEHHKDIINAATQQTTGAMDADKSEERISRGATRLLNSLRDKEAEPLTSDNHKVRRFVDAIHEQIEKSPGIVR